jgi:RNB domain
VYLGFYEGNHYCYTSAIGWLVTPEMPQSEFHVLNFVDPSDLQPLLDIIRHRVEAGTVQDMPATPEAAVIVVQALHAFEERAAAIYHENIVTFSKAEDIMGSLHKSEYRDIGHIADSVLPKYLKRGGKFSPVAMYAVHLALRHKEIAFHDVKPRLDGSIIRYEISSANDVDIVKKSEALLLELVELAANPKYSKLLKANALGKFIQKARYAISLSRARRSWSQFGVLGPQLTASDDVMTWTEEDLQFIRFMEMVGLQRLFPDMATVNALGLMILRLVEAYDEVPRLTPKVAFVFLQEIGWIAPWDIPVRHKVRLPETTVRRDGQLVRTPLSFEPSSRPDIAAACRKYRGGHKVYCIDKKDTTLIDDGISLERTEKVGEYWVHVHVADPSSQIRPDSEIFRAAQPLVADIYLPWQRTRMIPCEEVQDKFSLAAGRPCLTFSALLNENGEMLDYDIKPSRVENVLYTTPEEVLKVIPKFESPLAYPTYLVETLEVGNAPTGATSTRSIVTAQDLDDSERQDLNILARIGSKWAQRPIAKDLYNIVNCSNPSVEVRFDNVSASRESSDKDSSVAWCGEPYIKVQRGYQEPFELVEGLMIVAGVVAAKWCSDRRIPIPYRSAAPGLLSTDSGRKDLEEKIHSIIESGGDPGDLSVKRLFHQLWGTTTLSLNPKPPWVWKCIPG